MISEEQRSEIKKLSVVERCPTGTIAAQLGLHRQTVDKALKDEKVARETEKKSILDPDIYEFFQAALADKSNFIVRIKVDSRTIEETITINDIFADARVKGHNEVTYQDDY